MPKYTKIPLGHSFLTGMHVLSNPTLGGPIWNTVPYTLAKVKAVNDTEQAQLDLDRTEWYFGARKESKSPGRVEAERHATFQSHEEMWLYSWIVPEWQARGTAGGIHLDEALQKLIEKAQSLEQRLKTAKIESNLPASVETLKRYLQAAHSTGEEKSEALSTALHETITWMDEAVLKLSQTKAGETKSEEARSVDLSLNECKALCAYSVSIGDAVVLQGGCVRGVTENCFKEGWVRSSQDLHLYSNMDESFRLRRLPDGRISVSTYYTVYNICDMSAPQDLLASNPKEEPLMIISSEHILEEKVDAQGLPLYILKPEKQDLYIETGLLKIMLKRATKKLEKLETDREVWKPSDFYAFIPYLEDSRFRNLFCAALAKQPDFVIDFAKGWIMNCYSGGKFAQDITIVLDNIRKKNKQALAALPEEEKPRIIKSIYSIGAYRGYLNDSNSEEGFRYAVANEMRKLKQDSPKLYHSVVKRIQDVEKTHLGDRYNALMETIFSPPPVSVHLPEETFNFSDFLGREDSKTKPPSSPSSVASTTSSSDESENEPATPMSTHSSSSHKTASPDDEKSSAGAGRASAALFAQHESKASTSKKPVVTRDEITGEVTVWNKAVRKKD